MITALLSASFFALGFWARWFFYRKNVEYAIRRAKLDSHADGWFEGRNMGTEQGRAIGWEEGRCYEVAQQLARRKKRQDAAGRFKKMGRGA